VVLLAMVDWWSQKLFILGHLKGVINVIELLVEDFKVVEIKLYFFQLV